MVCAFAAPVALKLRLDGARLTEPGVGVGEGVGAGEGVGVGEGDEAGVGDGVRRRRRRRATRAAALRQRHRKSSDSQQATKQASEVHQRPSFRTGTLPGQPLQALSLWT